MEACRLSPEIFETGVCANAILGIFLCLYEHLKYARQYMVGCRKILESRDQDTPGSPPRLLSSYYSTTSLIIPLQMESIFITTALTTNK